MYKSRKAAWIRALRSGKYTQGTGTLCRIKDGEPVAWCCLGVLCDLAVKDGAPITVDNDYAERRYDNVGGHLPLSVMQWAGLDSNNPILTPETYNNPDDKCENCGGNHSGVKVLGIGAAAANDGTEVNGELKRFTFAEIADLIKDNL